MKRTPQGRGFLSRLSPALRAKLLDAATRLPFKDKQQIQSRGDAVDGFSMVQSGSVRFGTTGRNGSFLFIAQVREGDVFGDIAIFGAPGAVQDGYAVGKTVIDKIPRERFLTLVQENTELAVALLHLFGRRLVLTLDQLDDVMRQPLLVRLARYLLRQAEMDRSGERVQIGQADLAEAMGSSRVSISKALRELSDNGFLQTGYGYILLTASKKMKDWVSTQEEVEPIWR